MTRVDQLAVRIRRAALQIPSALATAIAKCVVGVRPDLPGDVVAAAVSDGAAAWDAAAFRYLLGDETVQHCLSVNRVGELVAQAVCDVGGEPATLARAVHLGLGRAMMESIALMWDSCGWADDGLHEIHGLCPECYGIIRIRPAQDFNQWMPTAEHQGESSCEWVSVAGAAKAPVRSIRP